jgi:hypothetical protein
MFDGNAGKMHPHGDLNIDGAIEECAKDYHYVLMQFTGLTDRNGKEIYIGDITSSGAGRLKEVVFNQSEMKTAIALRSSTGSITDVGLNCAEYLEVIGNIYENPEFLEK